MPLFFVIKQLNRGVQCFRRVPCLRNICADLLGSDKARFGQGTPCPYGNKGNINDGGTKKGTLAGALKCCA
jgi:hypothetical protein